MPQISKLVTFTRKGYKKGEYIPYIHIIMYLPFGWNEIYPPLYWVSSRYFLKTNHKLSHYCNRGYFLYMDTVNASLNYFLWIVGFWVFLDFLVWMSGFLCQKKSISALPSQKKLRLNKNRARIFWKLHFMRATLPSCHYLDIGFYTSHISAWIFYPSP